MQGDWLTRPRSTAGCATSCSRQPGVSVFTLGADGRARHFYSGGAIMAEGQYRGMDLLSPLWNFLDLTPEGRGDFMPQLGYGG